MGEEQVTVPDGDGNDLTVTLTGNRAEEFGAALARGWHEELARIHAQEAQAEEEALDAEGEAAAKVLVLAVEWVPEAGLTRDAWGPATKALFEAVREYHAAVADAEREEE